MKILLINKNHAKLEDDVRSLQQPAGEPDFEIVRFFASKFPDWQGGASAGRGHQGLLAVETPHVAYLDLMGKSKDKHAQAKVRFAQEFL